MMVIMGEHFHHEHKRIIFVCKYLILIVVAVPKKTANSLIINDYIPFSFEVQITITEQGMTFVGTIQDFSRYIIVCVLNHLD